MQFRLFFRTFVFMRKTIILLLVVALAFPVSSRACSAIIAHNHPDGIALPSREDEVFTRALLNALETVGIRLEDHIIVAEDDYISMADTGLLCMRRR